MSSQQDLSILWMQAPEGKLLWSSQDVESRGDAMRAWSVKDLASFFAQRDMEGPAQQLQLQGVAGMDFVELSSEELQTDVRSSASSARKLVRIRDAYLSGF